jgi:hypothetical protein
MSETKEQTLERLRRERKVKRETLAQIQMTEGVRSPNSKKVAQIIQDLSKQIDNLMVVETIGEHNDR